MITLFKQSASGHLRLTRLTTLPDGTTQQTGEWAFDNILTDIGLDRRIGEGGAAVSFDEAMQYCWVGSGNAAPAAGNTALASFMAASNTAVQLDTDDLNNPVYTVRAVGYTEDGRGFVSQTVARSFAPGVATGNNIREVGMANSGTPAGAVMMSRALVKDEDGLPITVAKGAADTLIVTYTLRVFTDHTPTDTVANISIGGVPTDVTIRPVSPAGEPFALVSDPLQPESCIFTSKQARHLDQIVGTYAGFGAFEAGEVMPATEDLWEIGEFTGASISTAVYTPGTRYGDITVQALPAALNLAGGISYFRMGTTQGTWGMSFDPPLAKTASNTLDFTIRVPALVRYTP